MEEAVDLVEEEVVAEAVAEVMVEIEIETGMIKLSIGTSSTALILMEAFTLTITLGKDSQGM